jgi:hypothetical protein
VPPDVIKMTFIVKVLLVKKSERAWVSKNLFFIVMTFMDL